MKYFIFKILFSLSIQYNNLYLNPRIIDFSVLSIPSIHRKSTGRIVILPQVYYSVTLPTLYLIRSVQLVIYLIFLLIVTHVYSYSLVLNHTHSYILTLTCTKSYSLVLNHTHSYILILINTYRCHYLYIIRSNISWLYILYSYL